MHYLLWSLLNTLIFIYFFYLFFGFIAKGRDIFSKRFKMISVVILGVGLLQIFANKEVNNQKQKNIILNDNIKGKTDKVETITLEDNLSLKNNLTIWYKEKDGVYIPVSYRTDLTEFITGFEWKTTSKIINEIKPREKAKYEINGALKWKLFGIEVYSQSKEYKSALE